MGLTPYQHPGTVTKYVSLTMSVEKQSMSAAIQSSWRCRTKGGDIWMGFGLATFPRLERIFSCQRVKSVLAS